MATKFAGKDLLLKIGDGASPEVFSTVAAQRSTAWSINNEQIDVTDKDDSRWRKLIEGGVRSMSLTASGLVNDHATYVLLTNMAAQGSIKNFQIVFADGMTFEGAFQLTTIEATGEHTDAQQYSTTLESAGDITFSDFETL